MSVIDTLKDLGGCAGGQLVYSTAKRLMQGANVQRKRRPLKPLIKSRLSPLFPIVDLSDVRICINATLVSGWFNDDVTAMTFGNRIFFKHSNIQKTEGGIRLLVHELQHVSQVVRYGGEDAFACKYGEGYLKAGSYEGNPLEEEAVEMQRGWLPDAQQVATLNWWEERNFAGQHHVKYLTHLPKHLYHPLVCPKRMKSLKLCAPGGWKLELYESASGSKDKHWAKVIAPVGSSSVEVAVPVLGKKGQDLAKPKGSYKIHGGGVGGLVSSIRVFSNEEPAMFEWWEERNFAGKKHVRYLYPSENRWKLLLQNRNDMRSCKLHAPPNWRLQLFDALDCTTLNSWAEITVPSNPKVTCAAVPRLGREGQELAKPEGCYKIHGGGVGGLVSSIRHVESHN